MKKAKRGSNKKVANSLVAVSSAAVLSVYAAGYSRTRTAALKFDAQSVVRRPVVVPAAPVVAVPITVPDQAPVAIVPKEKPASAVTEARLAPTSPIPAPTAASPTAALPAPVSPASPVVTPPPPPTAVPTPAPAVAPAPAATVWKDGTYTGWGTSRHGDIQASVVIEGGRIASATIAQCRTRYSCDVIDMLPPQVSKRQSAEVDSVSGATQSADAFYFAVVEALGKAK